MTDPLKEKRTYVKLESSEPIDVCDTLYCEWKDVSHFIEGVLDQADLDKEITFKVKLFQMSHEEYEQFCEDNHIQDI